MEIIGYIWNDYHSKFGVPRQSGLDKKTISKIILNPPYDHPDALRGIEGFSHLWILWQFSRAVREGEEFHATVRPPRLGGNIRMGVFATRSPFRPNHIAMTVVKLEGIEEVDGKKRLLVSGGDMMDQSPILDIKPYIPFADSIPDAVGGFADGTQKRLQVEIGEGVKVDSFMSKEEWETIQEVLSLDPRPAYKKDSDQVYGMSYGRWDLHFKIREDRVLLVGIAELL